MTRQGPASSGKARDRVTIWWLVACLAVLAGPLPSQAQSVLLFKGEAGPRASAWRAQLEAAVGPLPRQAQDAAAALANVHGVEPSRLASLRELEALLGEAQAQAGALAEQQALATL